MTHKYKILEVSESDAYYKDREKIVGKVGVGTISNPTDEGYVSGYLVLEFERKIPATNPNELSKKVASGETLSFNAIKVKRVGN